MNEIHFLMSCDPCHVGNHNFGILTLNYRNLDWTEVNGSLADSLQEAECKSTPSRLFFFPDGVKSTSLFALFPTYTF